MGNESTNPIMDGLPIGWSTLPTYAPDAVECARGHRFRSEADCVLPEGWDHFLCRRCLATLEAAPEVLTGPHHCPTWEDGCRCYEQ